MGSESSKSTNGPATVPQKIVNNSGKKVRGKWFMPAVLAGALLVGGGGAAYISVFNKSPQQLWESALVNTANGLEKFLDSDRNSKGGNVEGTFKLSDPVAADGTLKGQWYESNGSFSADVGAAGVRVNAEIRTIASENSDYPDLYFKLDGLEGVGSLLGAYGASNSAVGNVVDSLNGQWYEVDHTIFDQYATSTESDSQSLSTEEIQQLTKDFMALMRERFFSTAADKAVFEIEEEIGKEDFEGTSAYKVRAKVNKDNFKTFITELGRFVNDSSLKQVLPTGLAGSSAEDVYNFDKTLENIDEMDFSKATADVWIEDRGGFIRNVRIYPVDDKKDTNYLDFLIPYTGGDAIPLEIRATVDDDGAKGVFSLGVELNQNSANARLWVDVDMKVEGGTNVVAEAELKITASEDTVDVSAPVGAKSALELISSFTGSGLVPGGYLGSGGGSDEGINLVPGFDSDLLDDFEL